MTPPTSPVTPSGSVSLPGWEDIISIPHGPKPTREQIREYYRAQRERRAPTLPKDVIDEITRRRTIRDKIQSSAAPDTSRAWTSIMTWLDDAQDLFSLVKFGARAGLKLLPPGTVQTAFDIASELRWTKALLPRVLGRLIPGLGWILLGADILKLLTLLAGIIQPFFVGMCHGWSTGVAAAIPPLMMGNTAKLVGHGYLALNPFSRRARLNRMNMFRGKLFRFGEMLEIAQAMKTLTGYGLTLGGIMGTITESAYALELAARGEPIRITVHGGASVQLTRGAGTAYSAGSPGALSNLYDAVASTLQRPEDAANAKAHADALRQLSE